MIALLDSSAVLAAIFGEKGADAAFAAMIDGAISVVNLCEVYTRLAEDGVPVDTAQIMVRRFDLRVLPFTDRHAAYAGVLRPPTKHLGLSLGDRICLAHGKIDALPVVTADRKWAELDLGIDIRLIR